MNAPVETPEIWVAFQCICEVTRAVRTLDSAISNFDFNRSIDINGNETARLRQCANDELRLIQNASQKWETCLDKLNWRNRQPYADASLGIHLAEKWARNTLSDLQILNVVPERPESFRKGLIRLGEHVRELSRHPFIQAGIREGKSTNLWFRLQTSSLEEFIADLSELPEERRVQPSGKRGRPSKKETYRAIWDALEAYDSSINRTAKQGGIRTPMRRRFLEMLDSLDPKYNTTAEKRHLIEIRELIQSEAAQTNEDRLAVLEKARKGRKKG